MKRIVLSLLLCSVALLSLAQKKLYYCEVKGIEKELTSGLKIVFDFGEKASYNMWGDLSSKLKFVDEDGAEIKFNSMVDAANYMVDRGWRKRSIPTHSEWLYPLTFDAGNGLKEA